MDIYLDTTCKDATGRRLAPADATASGLIDPFLAALPPRFRVPHPVLPARRQSTTRRKGNLGVLMLVALLVFDAAAAVTPAPPLSVWVEGFRFEGATAFSASELDAVVARVVHLPATLDDQGLETARAAVEAHYRLHGYVNSLATLPDQAITSHKIVLRILEGRLSESGIYVHGVRKLDPDWILWRIQARVREPLQTNQLTAALQSVRQAGHLRSISATLRPSIREGVAVPGEAELDVEVRESSPWAAEVRVDNQRPPTVGAEQLTAQVGYLNPTGHGDVLRVSYGILQRDREGGVEFSGLDNLGVAYSLPVTPWDTIVSVSYDRRDYAVIEEPFQDLDILTRYWAAALRIDQPVWRDTDQEIALGLAFERRHSEGRLLGEPFSFTRDSVDGEVNVSVLRLSASWHRSWLGEGLSLRWVASFGLDAMDATVGTVEPDGQFSSFLGQGQYLRQLWNQDSPGPGAAARLIARASAQWAPDPLPAVEQLSLGGAQTVRGYRENLLVRDTGVLGSLELAVDVLKTSHLTLAAGPFVDVGAGWNIRWPTPDPVLISSAGVGLESSLWERVRVRIDWGHPFQDAGSGSGDLQDSGLHFSVVCRIF